MRRWTREYPDGSAGIVLQTGGWYLAVHLAEGYEGHSVQFKPSLDEAQRALDALVEQPSRAEDWMVDLIGPAEGGRHEPES